MSVEPPRSWWPVADGEAELGAEGAALLVWLRRTVAAPEPRLGRSGPLCPFVPIALRQRLVFGTTVESDADPVVVLEQHVRAFLATPPVPPDPTALNKTLLVVFPSEVRGPSLTAAVREIKSGLIERGVTCGEFFPDSDDRSARGHQVRVARSPVPLVALRYLSSHDRLFLGAHEEYGPLFEQWEAGRG